jgi:hypothetical protein
MIRFLILSLVTPTLASCGSNLDERRLNLAPDEPNGALSVQPFFARPKVYALQATLVRSGLQGGFC